MKREIWLLVRSMVEGVRYGLNGIVGGITQEFVYSMVGWVSEIEVI